MSDGTTHCRAQTFRRTLLIAHSADFVASLLGGRIARGIDFRTLAHHAPMRRWPEVLDRSAQPGADLRELIATGRVADVLQPWSPH